MRLRNPSRRAAATVEFAAIAPVTLLLLMGLMIGGLGMFRYQQCAYLAREGARWASVRGADYAQETGKPAATPEDVYEQVIAANATSLDLSRLTYSVTWDTDNRPAHAANVKGKPASVTNTVTVTVTYQWIPEAFLGGMTLSSTSVAVMSY
jgi:Flp pilus assembly protein TadG